MEPHDSQRKVQLIPIMRIKFNLVIGINFFQTSGHSLEESSPPVAGTWFNPVSATGCDTIPTLLPNLLCCNSYTNEISKPNLLEMNVQPKKLHLIISRTNWTWTTYWGRSKAKRRKTFQNHQCSTCPNDNFPQTWHVYCEVFYITVSMYLLSQFQNSQ